MCPWTSTVLQVRRHAAEQLYVQLLSWEAGPNRSFTEAEQERCMSLLTETGWDGPLGAARQQTIAVADALHVQLPALQLKEHTPPTSNPGAAG